MNLQKVISGINSGIAQFSTKHHKNNRPSVSFYNDYWYQRTTQWVKFYGIGVFFRILQRFFCIHRVIYLADLSAGFITKKNPKIIIFFWKWNILWFRNNLTRPVNLVKLAWKSRSHFLFEKIFLAFYIQPWQILVKRFSKHRPSGPMLSISRFIRLYVCLCVCLSICSLLKYRLNVFLPPLPEVGCPIFLEIRNPWGKVMERKGLRYEHFCLKIV